MHNRTNRDECQIPQRGTHGRRATIKRRALSYLSFLCAVLLFGVVFLCSVSAAVCNKTASRIVSAEDALLLEEVDTVIVLGCLVHADGTMSARLSDRVSTGVSLFASGVGEVLLMSGDRQADGSYDEVGAMKEAAVAAGIEESRILTDPYGYSTYESMVRLLEVYRGQRVVIVTQTYHLYRALYIAEKLGIEAWGLSADARPYRDQLRCEVREIPARVKDVWYMQIRPGVCLAES